MGSPAQRQADVAIRFMPVGKSPDSELTGRKVATAYLAAYGEGDCWIGQRGVEQDQHWVKSTPFPDLPVRGAIFDGVVLRAACAKGMGMAWIPCFLGDPLLPRRGEPVPGIDIWVLVHPDLRRSPRLWLFRDMVVGALKRLRPVLEGQAVSSAGDRGVG